MRLADALRLFAGSDLDCVAISEAADELDRLTADLAAERAEVERLRVALVTAWQGTADGLYDLLCGEEARRER